MEETVLSVGKSVLSGAVGYAKSAFAEEVALQLGIQRDHAFITDELEMMRSFMIQAHEERRDNTVVNKTWMKQVRDMAYDVEDRLQDFAVRLEKQTWWLFPRLLLERRRMATQMKKLRAKVEEISQRNARYHLIQGCITCTATAPVEKYNLMAAAIFGVDDARHAAKKENKRVDLIQLLNKEDEDLKVISVWGTSGDIGIASIIRAAYEDPNVQRKFLGRAWVRLMHPFCPKGFVQSLVSQFLAAEGVEGLLGMEKTTEQDLAQKFNEYVRDKRCLIVLNDLCTIEEWDQIRKCFQNNKKGSRIIVLTTQVEVASICVGQESKASELKQVSVDQTVYVFYEDKGPQNQKDLVKPPAFSSDAASSSSTNDHATAPWDIIEDQRNEDAGKRMVDLKSLTRVTTGSFEDSVKSTPTCSDAVATTIKEYVVAPTEIIMEDQSKDADEENTGVAMSLGALEESQLIGREKEISEIIDFISKKNSEESLVISVWGMGGLGKTTLVGSVCDRLNLSGKFDKYVFVRVTRPFVIAELLNSLVDQLHEESSMEEILSSKQKREDRLRGGRNKAWATSEDDVELTKKLTQELEWLLKMKSCLIVLDDLSSAAEWDQITQKIPSTEKASLVIVTTSREENIAKHCSGKHGIVYNLKVLEPDDALDLFSKKVFGKATDLVEKNPELVKEANQILKKCDGLPLAIVAIGGLLAKEPKNLAEWRKLNENISAELEMNPELGMIRAVLEKGYDGLPYDLKSCFLYLSIFPDDCTISRRRLVRRWTAEGYSCERRGRSAIEMADNYFTELKNRSMILSSQQSVHSIKSIDSCKIHDLIREIASSKSLEENLVFRLEEGCSLNTHGAFRHLAIRSNWEGDKSEFDRIVDVSRIRSLSVFGQWKEFFISDKMSFLRVLDLENTKGLVDHHLDRIGKLLHLKYISLRGCGDIFQLPYSLGNLRQLQTLDIRDTCIMALPKTIIKLRKLHYIHAGRKSEFVAEQGTSLMTRCRKVLKAVPSMCAVSCAPSIMEIDGLNRRDACTLACCVFPPATMMGLFDAGGVTVPRGIRKLKELHTLRVVHAGMGNSVLQDIKKLTGLRKLGVTGINTKNAPAFCSAISNLNKLESLSVRTPGETGLCGCLDSISSPPEKLQSLELYGNLETLPDWIKKLHHLVKLELGSTRLPEHDVAMKFLGQLQNLEILCLSGPSFQSEDLCFQYQQDGVAFRSLRVLKLAEVNNTKSVKFEEGAMPKLERLLLTGGVEKEIGFEGLQFLPNINEVYLSVYFNLDGKRIEEAPDPETRNRIIEEERQEAKDKDDEFKKKIREQLARNPKKNKPILRVD